MNPLAIFTGPYALLAKWGVIALLIAAFGGWAWFKGNEHGTQKLNDYIGKQATEAVRIAKARDKVTIEVRNRYIKVVGETQVVTQVIEKEVVRYAEANPGYCLDAAWRRLHDAAAANTVSDAAGGTDVAPRAAEALTTVTANYSAAQRNSNRLAALQEWVKKQIEVR